jgi:hypothetical protein
MKSGVSLGALRALLAVLIVCIAGCGKGGSSSSGDITAIAISPTSASVPINETEDFVATVTFTSPSSTSTTTTAVTWAVNGVSGGNATVGTIISDSADPMVGIYTSPTVVPTTNNGEVTITASAPRVPGSTSTTSGSTTTTTSNSTTVVSNTATVTVGAGLGLSITNTSPIVPAGSSFQFLATLNGVSTNSVTWSISSANGGQIGTIDAASGLYVAPPFPPPGAEVTVTATANNVASSSVSSNTATTTAEIVYSDHSLSGPFAFSYTGNDQDGFIAAAGSFVADGNGNIVSGVEDVESFASGVVSQLQFTGNYAVGADGRTTATILSSRGSATWAFVMTTNQHASLIRFDTNFTGGGSIDAQNTNDLTNSASVVAGPYVFTAAGADASFNLESVAGRFTADGGGNIPQSASVIDVSDNGSLTSGASGDTSLAGTYSIDTTNPGTGRGTVTLNSTTTGQLTFAFYLIDNTHLHIVEMDTGPLHPWLAGDVLAGATGSSFSNANLAAGNYAFTAGGNSSTGAYAVGGVFTSDGSANVTGGVIDKNNAGTLTANSTLGSCPFTVNATNSRTDLKIFVGSGSCPATPNSAVAEFAAYPTALGGLVMLEIDPAAVTTGGASAQTSATASLSGNFALGLFGQGVFHNSPSSTQGDLIGGLDLSGTAVTSGNLNLNNFTAVFPQADPIIVLTSSLSAPGSNGRGTLVLAGTDPVATYNLIYYLINGSTALVLDQDKSRVAIGVIANQF